MIGHFPQDARYALRAMRKRPAASIVAILSLAIGLGANATIFSFVNALLLRPLPVADPSRLIEVWHHRTKSTNAFMSYMTLSFPDFVYYRDHNQVFSSMGAMVPETRKVSWIIKGEGHNLQAQVVSNNFFNVLGIQPAVGRFFTDAQEPPGVVVSYSLWKRLGGDPALVGTSWNLNGRMLRVLGVAPPGLNGLVAGSAVDVWAPFRDEGQIGSELDWNNRHIHGLIGLGRLKPGTGGAQADADIRLLGQQLATAFPETNKDSTGGTFPAQLIPGPMRKLAGMFTALLLAVMTLVLLIGCANAANVVLAQASSRSRETAVRSALGANRGRLVLQTLNECILTALLSGAAGYVAACFAAPLLLRLSPANLHIELDVVPDWRVGLFVFGFSLLTGIVFGLLPAIRGTRLDLSAVMNTGGRGAVEGRSRLRSALIVAQVAVCLVLLVAGSLCVRSLQAARNVAPGFNPGNLFVSSLELGPFGYSEAQGRQFYRKLIARLSAMPGVEAASLTDHLPLGTREEGVMVDIPGIPAPHGMPGWPVGMAVVAPGYFKTMQTAVLRGREFAWRDTNNAPGVVVINDAMARQFWPGEDAVGKQIRVQESSGIRNFQVIGIVQTGKYKTLGEDPTPFLYQPLTQRYSNNAIAVVRTSAEPASFSAAFRFVVRELDPRLALFDMGAMRQQLEFAFFTARISAVLLGIAGILALVLALAGVYGVIAYIVAQRTHEIGVRVALGATSANVLGMLLGHSLKMTGAGVAIGLLFALVATRLLGNILYGIEPTDAVTFIGVAVGLLLLSMLATYLPARLAMRVSPLDALRGD